ncbi:protein starmaker [Penaeus vannamei]|uniref:protein starmaker n=1 Tax=Penaeus vannamei TaxID=6689 RepID=UPI00387FB0F6
MTMRFPRTRLSVKRLLCFAITCLLTFAMLQTARDAAATPESWRDSDYTNAKGSEDTLTIAVPKYPKESEEKGRYEGKNSHAAKSQEGKNSHDTTSHEGKNSHVTNSHERKNSHVSKSRYGKNSHDTNSHEGKNSHDTTSHEGKNSHDTNSHEGKNSHDTNSHEGKNSHDTNSHEGKNSHDTNSHEGKNSHEAKTSHEGKTSHAAAHTAKCDCAFERRVTDFLLSKEYEKKIARLNATMLELLESSHPNLPASFLHRRGLAGGCDLLPSQFDIDWHNTVWQEAEAGVEEAAAGVEEAAAGVEEAAAGVEEAAAGVRASESILLYSAFYDPRTGSGEGRRGRRRRSEFGLELMLCAQLCQSIYT